MNELNYPKDEEISLALTGSEDKIDWALGLIYMKYGSELFALASARLGNDNDDANDAVQETLLTVLKMARNHRWNKAKPLENFLKWVLKRRAIDIYWKRQTDNRHLSGTPLEEETNLPSIPDKSGASTAEALDEFFGSENFDRFVASLTPVEKLVAEFLGKHWLRNHDLASVDEMLTHLNEIGEPATIDSIKSIRKRMFPKMGEWMKQAEIL